MGKKRIQNVLDEQIGEFLANFEYDLLSKIDDQVMDRLDLLNSREKEFIDRAIRVQQAAQDIEEVAEEVRKEISWKIDFRSVVIGFMGGAGFFFSWLLARWVLSL